MTGGYNPPILYVFICQQPGNLFVQFIYKNLFGRLHDGSNNRVVLVSTESRASLSLVMSVSILSVDTPSSFNSCTLSLGESRTLS